jgi:D-arabinose 1-dehydrogenase-like Zn-dependent alcohol dehydrogenase
MNTQVKKLFNVHISMLKRPSTAAVLSVARHLSTMRQVVLQAPGSRAALHPEIVIYKPAKLEKNHVRIRVAACAVAYRDIIDRNGGFPFMNQPTVLGHEFAGIVDAAGTGSSLKPGERVVSLHWAQYGGEAFPSPFTHAEAMKTFLGLTCNGGYAEYVTTHESAFVSVPNADKWSAVYASPVMSTFGTVWQGAVVRGKLSKGESGSRCI